MASARRRPRRERKLPVQQLSILALCRFAEPIASTSLLPYLPEMVKSFHVPPQEVGKWAGLCSAVFALSQAVMGITWGRISDRYGRKPAILLGLTSTMLTMLLWGFSRSLGMALAARTLAGAANGNVGIIRTTVAEMVPFKELQPRAFSLMPLVWNVGSVFGPMLGGALANPLNVRPDQRRDTGSLLEVYPYALPNIVAAGIFLVGIITGILFLEETMEAARDRRDYGLILGNRIIVGCPRAWRRVQALARGEHSKADDDHEREPLIRTPQHADEEDALTTKPKPKQPPPGWREVLTRQSILNLIAYTLLACHTMAYDQLTPVFLQTDPISAPDSTPYSPPLKFAGGFGLDHFTIGLLSTANGIVGMLCQFFLFPPLARAYGSFFWLQISACVFPGVYLLTPFTALLPSPSARLAVQLALMTVKNIAGVFAFPCSTILLTNSAASLRTLGTLNGIATSAAALGRAAGPAAAGAVFSFGVKRGYVIAPWWTLAALAVLAAASTCWLVEGEGFGGEDEVADDEDDEDEVADDDDEVEGAGQDGRDGDEGAVADGDIPDALVQTAATAGASQAAGAGPAPLVPDQQLAQADTATTIRKSLSRNSTADSQAVLIDDEDEDPRRVSPNNVTTTTTAPSSPQRQRVTRKISMPIGTGGRGVARRYSSNLGQSLGSAGSQGGY